MVKTPLLGTTLGELEAFVRQAGYSPSLARGVLVWLYQGKGDALLEQAGIPMGLRIALNERYHCRAAAPVGSAPSADGSRKYLFRTPQGYGYEAVFIPSPRRGTLCVSTQLGCRMGCRFCHTGALGFRGNLTAHQILSQLYGIAERAQVSRIVLMGMGEPLDNLDATLKALQALTADWGLAFGAGNITLSTVGMASGLRLLLGSRLCNIAVSLHSPWPLHRLRLMPAEAAHPLLDTIQLLRGHPLPKPLRLSFEYVVLPGENDSYDHALAVRELLSGMACHVNVIPYNGATPSAHHQPAAARFHGLLNRLGQAATLRQPRATDIGAACGMMVAQPGAQRP